MRVFTIIHGRHETTRAFLWHLEYLRNETGLELPLSLCYSEQEDYEAIKDLLTKQDHILQFPNKPVAYKWQFVIDNMLINYDFDSALQICSDDLISTEYLQALNNYKGHFAGTNQTYFYSPQRNKMVEWEYNGMPFKTLGVGRKFSRELLEKGSLYTQPLNKGLDNHSEGNIRQLGYRPFIIRYDKPQAVDIKTEGENIHSFDEFASNKEVSLKELERITPIRFE